MNDQKSYERFGSQIFNSGVKFINKGSVIPFMITNMDLFFLLRTKQRKKRLNITVYCRVTTYGPRAEFSTGIKLTNMDLWDHSTGMFCNNDQLGIVYNKILTTIRAELEAVHLNLHIQKLPYGPNTIINIYRGDTDLQTTFVKACKEYMKEREVLLTKNEISGGTITKDQLYIRHIQEFLTATKRPALLPQEFDIAIANEFRTWLYENLKQCSKTNAARHIEFCKRILDACIPLKYIKFNPIASLKTGRDRNKKKINLEKEEVEKMLITKFEVQILQHCAHLYLFQCGNGFSYADIYKEFYIVNRPEGEFFAGNRKKGDTEFFVPVFPLSRMIYNLYKGKLPYVENRTYNRCLKQLAPMLGITKKLTTHTARKTFATLKDDEGWSVGSISAMLGHQREETTVKHYINRTEKRVINELKRMNSAA